MPRTYSPADWYWSVGNGPVGQVYASARFTYVSAATDPDYLDFLAGGDFATTIDTEANLRDALEAMDVAFTTLPLRPLEVLRPRVHGARCRLTRAGQSIASATPTAISWTGGFDPRNMNNPGGANPDRVVIPAGQGGIFLCLASVNFAANATGDRAVQIRQGGAPIATARVRAPAALEAEFQTLGFAQLNGGDIVRVFVSQDSGAALATSAALTLLRIE